MAFISEDPKSAIYHVPSTEWVEGVHYVLVANPINNDAQGRKEIEAPLDMNGRTIEVGQRVLVPFSKGGAGNAACMRYGRVVKFYGIPEHQGYGYFTMPFQVLLEDTGKKVKFNYPHNCLVVA